MSVEAKAAYLKGGIDDSWLAVQEKGVTVATRDIALLGDKIRAIPTVTSGDGWQRPIDRPVKSIMVDDTILMLFGVSEYGMNCVAFIVGCTGGYIVDWGDGTIDNFPDASKCEHAYEFESVQVPTDSKGYKMVWIKIQPATVPQHISSFSVLARHSALLNTALAVSAAPTMHVFELYIQCPLMTSLILGASNTSVVSISLRQLEIFSLSENKITYVSCLLYYCNSLRIVGELYLGAATAVAQVLSYCYAFDQDITIALPLATTVSYVFYYCNSLNSKVGFVAPLATAVSDILKYCASLIAGFSIDYLKVTSTTISFLGNYGLTRIDLNNLDLTHKTIMLTSMGLSREGIRHVFNSLPDRMATTAGAITITGCAGIDGITAEDLLIPTNKNWTVVK